MAQYMLNGHKYKVVMYQPPIEDYITYTITWNVNNPNEGTINARINNPSAHTLYLIQRGACYIGINWLKEKTACPYHKGRCYKLSARCRIEYHPFWSLCKRTYPRYWEDSFDGTSLSVNGRDQVTDYNNIQIPIYFNRDTCIQSPNHGDDSAYVFYIRLALMSFDRVYQTNNKVTRIIFKK